MIRGWSETYNKNIPLVTSSWQNLHSNEQVISKYWVELLYVGGSVDISALSSHIIGY